MDDQSQANRLKNTSKSLLEMFNEYAKDVYGIHRLDGLGELRIDLQRRQHLKV